MTLNYSTLYKLYNFPQKFNFCERNNCRCAVFNNDYFVLVVLYCSCNSNSHFMIGVRLHIYSCTFL